MLSHLIFVLFLTTKLSFADNTTVYDKFTGEPVTDENLATFEAAGLTSTCTITVGTCSYDERRRVDGSCNSLDHPSRGTYLVPQARILRATYHNNSHARLAGDGKALELARIVRSTLLWEGKSISQNFTQSMPGFMIWTFGDVGSVHDITYFLVNKTDCCEPEHMKDAMCTPNIYPEDDPVHRFSGIRCTNLTKPLDHQFMGCTNDTTPSPIARSTGVMDLSQIYNAANRGEAAIRAYEGGLLATETDQYGVVWPPSSNGSCIGNKVAEGETRCFSNYPFALLSGTFFGLWLMRFHNYCANQLALVNPTWTDDQLFYAAREINIAQYLQILYYEWLPDVIGEKYLFEKEIIAEDQSCHRDIYDSSKYPEATLEYIYILRYFHTAQENTANKYYTNGTFMGGIPQTELMFRPGYMGKDNNIMDLTQGLYRQPCARMDHGVDPEISEIGLPTHLQRSADITTSDLEKGRTLGMAPYIDYIDHCFGINITCWDDLKQIMSDERIELMKRVYKEPRDIDLLAGAWSENNIEGGSAPAVVSCLIVDYLKKAIVSDRHWYERANRPYAFTKAQLQEIRKASLAQLICKSGDGVTQIQPKAFLTISKDNPLVDCSEITSFDFRAWADATTTD